MLFRVAGERDSYGWKIDGFAFAVYMWGWWLCTRYSRHDALSRLDVLSIPGRYYVFRHCDCLLYAQCTRQRGSFVSCLLIIQFCLQSIYSFFSLRRRKPSIAFGNLWSIVFYCGILGDGRWLVFALSTRSLISYSWSAFCFLWKCYVSTPLLMRPTKSVC